MFIQNLIQRSKDVKNIPSSASSSMKIKIETEFLKMISANMNMRNDRLMVPSNCYMERHITVIFIAKSLAYKRSASCLVIKANIESARFFIISI